MNETIQEFLNNVIENGEAEIETDNGFITGDVSTISKNGEASDYYCLYVNENRYHYDSYDDFKQAATKAIEKEGIYVY